MTHFFSLRGSIENDTLRWRCIFVLRYYEWGIKQRLNLRLRRHRWRPDFHWNFFCGQDRRVWPVPMQNEQLKIREWALVFGSLWRKSRMKTSKILLSKSHFHANFSLNQHRTLYEASNPSSLKKPSLQLPFCSMHSQLWVKTRCKDVGTVAQPKRSTNDLYASMQ